MRRTSSRSSRHSLCRSGLRSRAGHGVSSWWGFYNERVLPQNASCTRQNASCTRQNASCTRQNASCTRPWRAWSQPPSLPMTSALNPCLPWAILRARPGARRAARGPMHSSSQPESPRGSADRLAEVAGRRCDRTCVQRLRRAVSNGVLLLLVVLLGLAGCSIGPGMVTRDRFDYSGAVAESWKRQMLLNLVKLRYSDAPVFLDVGAVAAATRYRARSRRPATSSTPAVSSPVCPAAASGSVLRANSSTGRPSPTPRSRVSASPAR